MVKYTRLKHHFSQLKNERLIDTNTDTLTSIQYGFFVDDNQAPYYGKPLLFYPILNSGNSISFLDTTSSHSEVNTI